MRSMNLAFCFVVVIFGVVWGGYNMAKTYYVASAWERTEGTIVDLERHEWRCGKGVSHCHSLFVGYSVGEDYFTLVGDKKVDGKESADLLGNKVVVYYFPADPAEAILGGSYGLKQRGTAVFVASSVFLGIFWLMLGSQA